MKRSSQLERSALEALRERLSRMDALRTEYADRPREFLGRKEFGYRWPDTLAGLFDAVYEGRVARACVLGARGTGKTFIAAGLGFALFLFKEWNVGIVSGSKEQALRVIEYVQDITGDENVVDYVEDETKTLIRGKRGNWIKASPASTKAIRGLHARKRPMLLILDEEAEMKPEILRAALKTVKDAPQSAVVRLSTMHQLEGTFAELVANHGKMGYELYRVDSFDVAGDCRTPCSKCLAVYAGHYEAKELRDLQTAFHDQYCRERPKRNAVKGWQRVEEIRQAYMESPLAWFETEDMALKPSGEGKVLPYDQVVKLLEDAPLMDPVAGARVTAGVDWGFKGQMTLELVQWAGKRMLWLESEEWSEADVDVLIQALGDAQERYQQQIQVYADASHPYENNLLREAGFDVEEVPFATYKETGAGFLNHLFRRALVWVAGRFPSATTQLKEWRRDQHGKIVKQNDHHCDALLAGTKAAVDQIRGEAMVMKGLRLAGAGPGFFRLVHDRRGKRPGGGRSRDLKAFEGVGGQVGRGARV